MLKFFYQIVGAQSPVNSSPVSTSSLNTNPQQTSSRASPVATPQRAERSASINALPTSAASAESTSTNTTSSTSGTQKRPARPAPPRNSVAGGSQTMPKSNNRNSTASLPTPSSESIIICTYKFGFVSQSTFLLASIFVFFIFFVKFHLYLF